MIKIPLINKLGKNEINDTITKINRSIDKPRDNFIQQAQSGRVAFKMLLTDDKDNIKIEGLDFQQYSYTLNLYVENNSAVTVSYHLYCGEDMTPANYYHNRIYRQAVIGGTSGAAPCIANLDPNKFIFLSATINVSQKGKYCFISNSIRNDATQANFGYGINLNPSATSLHLLCTNSDIGGTSVAGFGRDSRIILLAEG